MRLHVLTLAAFLAAAQAANGADLAYGADALPFLTTHASVIVEVGPKVKTLKKADSDRKIPYSLYQVKVGAVLKGKAKQGTELRALFPPGEDVKEADKLSGAILFLWGPLDKDQAKAWGAEPGEDLFGAVSGRSGVVPGKDEDDKPAVRAKDVKAAVRAYVEASGSNMALLEWATEHAASKNTFLQRSASLTLERQAAKLQDEKIAKVVTNTMWSREVTVGNKLVMLNALGNNGGKDCLGALKECAEMTESRVSRQVRHRAVEILGGFKEGEKVLKEWQTGDDKVLAAKATEVIARQKSSEAQNVPTKQQEASLVERLTSADRKTRLEGINESARYEPTVRIQGSLRKLMENDKEDLSIRLLAVKAVARGKEKADAEALASIAKEKNKPSLLRRSAVLGIAKMPPKVRGPVLESLSRELDDPEVKALLDGLLEEK
jgi:hypothetical protein